MPSPTFTRALNKKLQRERRLREARRQAAYAQLCAADAEPRTRRHNARQLVDAKISANIVPHALFLRHMQARRLSKDNHISGSASHFVAGRASNVPDARPRRNLTSDKGEKTRAMLRARLGEDIYACWFASMQFESFDGGVVRGSVPVKFIKKWIQAHYADELLQCCAAEFAGVQRIELVLRQPHITL